MKDEQLGLFASVASSVDRNNDSSRGKYFLGGDGAAIGADSRSRDFFISAWGVQRSSYFYQAGLLWRRDKSQREKLMRFRLIAHVLLTLLAVSYISVSVANNSKATSLCVWAPYAVIALAITIINLRKEYHDKYSKRNR